MTALLRFDGERACEADIEAHTPEMRGQRRHLLRQLAVTSGQRVLDVGCGPGYLISELVDPVGPDGAVYGIDISASMLDLARARCAPAGARVNLVAGRCEEIPFPDASFDAAVSSQVYEYVGDIARALAELYRVLRPGGRAVVLDTDWDSLVWHSADRPRMRRVLTLWEDHVADPRLPRRLGPLLQEAGFTEESLTTLTFLNRRCHRDAYSYWQVGFIEAFLAGHPRADPDETRAWGRELRALDAAGQYFFSLGRYAFTVVKPGD